MNRFGRHVASALKSAGGVSLVLAFWAVAAVVLPSQGQEPLPPGVEIDLKDQLERGLKARLPSEFEYVDQIALLVKEQQLPLDLVISTFHYARHKRPYPIQYFHRALVIRAARQGIAVDALELVPPIPG